MNLAVSFTPSASPGTLRLSPSKKSPNPKRGSALLPYHGFPHLLGTDPRRAAVLHGLGEVGVFRFAFISEEDCAPFGDPFAYPVPDDLVLCAVAKGADPAKLSLPHTLESQPNLTFLIAIDGALGDALADQLAALRLKKVERCTPADLVHIAAPPALDTHTAPCDYPPDEPPPPPAAVAVEADTMKRKAADTSFDVATFELDALLEASEATAAAPVIDDNHTTQLDEHADPSPPAVAAPALGGAAAVDDAARTNTSNEAAHGEEEGENIRRARCAARMDADQDASEPHQAREPLLELSVGVGRPWFDEDGSIKKDERGRKKSPLDLEKVKPWVGTPRELHAFLNSHRYASTNKSFKHKVGHFIVGAVFAGTEEHPAGHRHSDSLQRATLVLFDIDNAPDLTRAELEARLRSLGVGFIFYSTWSNARAGSGKTGLCARIVFWLTRPLTAPDDLPQAPRVQSIGQQLAAIVRHLSACLDIDSTKAVDEVSKRPHQLMYSPRGHDAGRSGPDCWWCELRDGPALNPDSLPGGVSLADLLPPSAPQLTDTNEPSATPTPPHPPSTSSKAAPQTRKGSDGTLRARGLAYIEACAEDLKTLSEGRYERITQRVGPRCGSIAAGHGLTEAEGLEPLEKIVNGWGRLDLTKALLATFAHGYRDPRTLPDSDRPRSPSKSSKKTPPPDLDAAAPSPASDAQPDTAPPHTEATSTAPVASNQKSWAVQGNSELGYFLTTEQSTFDALCLRDVANRPNSVLLSTHAQLDMICKRIKSDAKVFVEIAKTHPLYPLTRSLIILPFKAKWRAPTQDTN